MQHLFYHWLKTRWHWQKRSIFLKQISPIICAFSIHLKGLLFGLWALLIWSLALGDSLDNRLLWQVLHVEEKRLSPNNASIGSNGSLKFHSTSDNLAYLMKLQTRLETMPAEIAASSEVIAQRGHVVLFWLHERPEFKCLYVTEDKPGFEPAPPATWVPNTISHSSLKSSLTWMINMTWWMTKD